MPGFPSRIMCSILMDLILYHANLNSADYFFIVISKKSLIFSHFRMNFCGKGKNFNPFSALTQLGFPSS